MSISQHIFRLMLPALLCGAVGPFAGAVHAVGLAGVFDAGWSTAYYSQDSITHMHQRLHAIRKITTDGQQVYGTGTVQNKEPRYYRLNGARIKNHSRNSSIVIFPSR